MRKLESINPGYPGKPIHAYVDRPLQKRLAPIGLFDHFHGQVPHNIPGGWHPHSGIATFTYMLAGGLTHNDTNGLSGLIKAGGVQWLSAGKGIWHDGAFQVADTDGIARDLQLWFQLPPEHEMGTDYPHEILSSEEIPRVGNTKVLLGEYRGVKSPVEIPVNAVYLHVALEGGESWDFKPPPNYDRGFIYPFEDAGLEVAGTRLPPNQMGIFEDDGAPINVRATEGQSHFVITLAEPADFPTLARRGSIHTSEERMRESMEEIGKLGQKIRN